MPIPTVAYLNNFSSLLNPPTAPQRKTGKAVPCRGVQPQQSKRPLKEKQLLMPEDEPLNLVTANGPNTFQGNNYLSFSGVSSSSFERLNHSGKGQNMTLDALNSHNTIDRESTEPRSNRKYLMTPPQKKRSTDRKIPRPTTSESSRTRKAVSPRAESKIMMDKKTY